MNIKIKNYVDALFSDLELNKKNLSLKADLANKMQAKFQEYIMANKTENQAFNLVVANLVNVNELLEDIVIDDQKNDQTKYYLKRNARNIAIGVSLYIIGVAVLIGFGGLSDYFNLNAVYPIIGLIILLVLSAFATGLIVYSNMSTPQQYKNYNHKSDDVYRYLDSKKGRTLNLFISVYWLIVTFAYLIVSFTTNKWAYTWVIWILAAAIEGLIKAFYNVKYKSN